MKGFERLLNDIDIEWESKKKKVPPFFHTILREI